MSKLLIVESPSKAKTIEKYLNGKYIVRASVGHVRDLPKSNGKAIDIPNGFIPHYEISKDKEKVIRELESIAQKSTEIILATDPDREGEAISWHLAEILKQNKKITAPMKRAAFNEITKEAIELALQNPRDIDTNLVKAQEARRVLDRLVGYDLSGLIWKKVRYGLSAGRVQSPALRILCEREREINAFIPETYWTLSGVFTTPKGEVLTLSCSEEPRDKKEVVRILELGTKGKWSVIEIKESEQKRSPRAPFTTSTLQQTASSRLGLSPSRTMQIAQRLYEEGHITYMRTDSTNLGAQAQSSILAEVTKKYGSEYAEAHMFKTKSKNAQEAHEAIRPTHIEKHLVGSTEEQQILYKLIWERTMASQMADAKLFKTKIIANIETKDIPDFVANGSRLIFPGWLAADKDARGEDVELPELKKGDALVIQKLSDTEKQTEPPNRYSEAGLIKELEARGIGRPSTYASIIKTLLTRGYVENPPSGGRSLKPTDTGDVVSLFLETNFMDYISDTFTAEMENKLDEIASGDREYKKTLSDFYGPFTHDVQSKENIPKITNMGEADSKYICPKCKASMVIKLGRGGKFLSCATYPDCDGALTIDGKEIRAEEPLGIHPETKLPIYVMNGRFGPYVQMGESPKIPKKTTFPKGHKKTDSEKEMLKKEAEEIKRAKELPRPKMASIPAHIKPEEITMDQAVHLLVLPRTLGQHPDDGEPVIANIGKFGPYIGHNRDFRSIKKTEKFTPYDITLEQALHLLNQPKSLPKGVELFKNLGKHPKTGKDILLLKSKSGFYMQKGLKRIWLDSKQNPEKFTLDDAIKML